MFSPSGCERSISAIYTSCICDMCTNNNCDICHSYKNIGYSNDNIEEAEYLYESSGMDAVVEKFGVESSTYTLYYENQKLKVSNNEIDLSDIDLIFGININDNLIIADLYYKGNEIGSINTGKVYSGFSEFIDFQNNFKPKVFKGLKLEKSTKKELVRI